MEIKTIFLDIHEQIVFPNRGDLAIFTVSYLWWFSLEEEHICRIGLVMRSIRLSARGWGPDSNDDGTRSSKTKRRWPKYPATIIVRMKESLKILKLNMLKLLANHVNQDVSNGVYCFRRRVFVASNAIQTMDNAASRFIISCLNCIRRDENSTSKTGLTLKYKIKHIRKKHIM